MLAVLLICVGLAIVVIVLSFRVHTLSAQAVHAAQPAEPPRQLAPAKPDNTQAQADLEKARAASADLKSQLEKAKSRAGDLQSQLDRAKAQSADLQAKIDAAGAQSADLQAKLDKASAQAADLQGQLNEAAARSSQQAAQLDQAKARAADLQARLQKSEGEIARLQPLVQRARHLPVTMSVEKAHGGPFSLASAGGLTLHVSNLYLEPLSVVVAITDPDGTRSQSAAIAGGATLKLEKLADGDTVVVSSEGYDPVTLTVH